MEILIVTPAPKESLAGNRVTAQRWERLLRELGHRVEIATEYQDQTCDLLIAIHARKSAVSVDRFANRFPDKPLVLLLSGTDIYQDLAQSPETKRSIQLAWRLVILQPEAAQEVPKGCRHKCRVIYQSVSTNIQPAALKSNRFEVCVVGHLRAVKDPLRAAEASRLLPPDSTIRITQIGAALEPEYLEQALQQQQTNPRYRWRGEIERNQVLQAIAGSHLLVLTSLLEGGANVISEAVVLGTPVISSHIPGSVGLLGADYPGFFPPEDTQALSELLYRAETDVKFYQSLETACQQRNPLFLPDQERNALARLLEELHGH